MTEVTIKPTWACQEGEFHIVDNQRVHCVLPTICILCYCQGKYPALNDEHLKEILKQEKMSGWLFSKKEIVQMTMKINLNAEEMKEVIAQEIKEPAGTAAAKLI
jgi:hypothetical protein